MPCWTAPTLCPDVQAAICAYEQRGTFTDGDETWSVAWMRDGDEAEGMCSTVSRDFAEFCRQRGLDAYDSGYLVYEPGGGRTRADYEHLRNPLLETQHSPDDFGYHDRIRHSSYPEHSATIIETDTGEILCVDWTASQFGYSEFPRVQAKTPDGWQLLSAQAARAAA